MNQELPFTSQLWEKLRDYLSKYRVAGQKLDAKPLGSIQYYGKIPDIVVVDEKGIPQLIIETKRKSENRHWDIYDPLGKAPIAQALCYSALALKYHNLDRTPLFATANSDVMIVFRGIEKEKLGEFVDIERCREKHYSPEDWANALKHSAYSRLLQEYILARLEKPLSDDTIKKLFDAYVANWIIKAPITPAQLYRILVDQLKYEIDKLHDEYVEEAVKARTFEDPQYFIELHELAVKQGYTRGILSPGLFLLCPNEDRSSIEEVCKPLANKIGEALSKAKNIQELYTLFIDTTSKHVRELVEYCKEQIKKGKIPPTTCNKKVRDVISFRNLSRMMTYALVSKILAYKVLELHYDIPRLSPLDIEKLGIRSSEDVINTLNKFFEDARKKLEERLNIKDFGPIFQTGLYDKIALKGLDAITRINALIEIADAIKESLRHLPGILGYVYEGFIPPRERHQLGQFYTPPAIARLITRWAIRSKDDRVLDGGCGSGTFLIEAYKRLLLLKFNKVYGENFPICKEEVNEHQEILNNLYGVDINAFASQLSVLHLMFMEPRCPFLKLNVETKDFFSLTKGNILFDAVIGNPPYTRWVEIPESTKELIKERVGDLMRAYDLVPDIGRGREPGIYVYWILHATKNLLRNGGRLGMIISNMWLQTNYGIGFGKFLLNNYKIKALIDISYRLFEALISTVIILAEKEPSSEARENNTVLLVRIPPIDSRLSDAEVEKKLDEALKCIENAATPSYDFDRAVLENCKQSYGIWYRFVKQSEIPRDKKWVSLFFERREDVVKILETDPLIIRASEWFKPSRGNSVWSIWALDHRKRPDLGAKDFFYFSRDKIGEWEEKVRGFRDAVTPYLVPAITASRYVKTFTFTEKDWTEVRDAWILVLHERRENLPQPLQKYIEWGETECRTRIKETRGGGRVCSDAEACKARTKKEARKFFYGWYDLGGYIPTPIMAVRQAGYHPQFFLVTMPNLITYDAIITLIPRVKIRIGSVIYDPNEYNKLYGNIVDSVKPGIELDEVEVKALLAYLNSTFNWLWLEQNGRRTGGGILALETEIVEKMPILNIKLINRVDVEELAKLFDELESSARQVIGEDRSSGDEESESEGGEKLRKLRMFMKLRSVLRKIDNKIAEILGLSIDVDELWNSALEMMKRRIEGAKRRVRPGAEVGISVDVKGGKSGKKPSHVPLDKWFKPKS
uniref:site-specific DNA-methyltransferase (adenine-specific) n=1 Tax=Ignisphaera aggregans TaxID=334771 RepID=A0A7J2T9L8_9CREN